MEKMDKEIGNSQRNKPTWPTSKRKLAYIKSVREMQIKITMMYLYTHQTGKKVEMINNLYW